MSFLLKRISRRTRRAIRGSATAPSACAHGMYHCVRNCTECFHGQPRGQVISGVFSLSMLSWQQRMCASWKSRSTSSWFSCVQDAIRPVCGDSAAGTWKKKIRLTRYVEARGHARHRKVFCVCKRKGTSVNWAVQPHVVRKKTNKQRAGSVFKHVKCPREVRRLRRSCSALCHLRGCLAWSGT